MPLNSLVRTTLRPGSSRMVHARDGRTSCRACTSVFQGASFREPVYASPTAEPVTGKGMAPEASKGPTRKLRLFLRDFRMIEATITVAENQALTTWLANRKSYVNLRGAKWASTDENIEHAVLKVQQVLWAASMDNDIPLTTAVTAVPPRLVEVQLEGGLLLRGGLSVGGNQRLSDYLDTHAQFIPIRNAVLLRSGRPPKEVNVTLGDVVLNQDAVQAMWEVEAQARGEAASVAEGSAGH